MADESLLARPLTGTRLRVPLSDVSSRTRTLVALAVGIAVVAARVASMPPTRMTTDLARHLNYADLVRAHGLGSLRHTLKWWGMPERSAWHDNVYNYPPVPLLLFTALRSLGIGLVGAKVVLTCIDGLTGLLIGIRSRSRVLGIAAAALPQAQRWVTGEGQYEPLQAAFTVGSLVALERFPFVAGVLLALAVQSKVTAVFVVPALLWQAHRIGRRHRRRTGLGLAAGLAPSLVFQLSYPLVQQVLGESSLVPDNAWRLRPFGGPLFSPLGGPLAPMLYGTMLAVVGAALWFALRRRAGIDHLATLAFAGFVFLHANVAPWYLLLLPSFAVVPREVTQRRVMLVIAAVAGLVTVRLASG